MTDKEIIKSLLNQRAELNKEADLLRRQASSADLMLAAILLGRFAPLAPHHCAAIRERLHGISDDELIDMVHEGRRRG